MNPTKNLCAILLVVINTILFGQTSTNQLYNTAKDWDEEIPKENLYEKANNFFEMGDINTAIMHSIMALDNPSIERSNYESAKFHLLLAKCYLPLGQIEQTKKHLSRARGFFPLEEDLNTKVEYYALLGNLNNVLGDFDKGLEYHYEAFEISQETNSQILIGKQLFNIAATHIMKADYSKVDSLLKKVLEIAIQEDDLKIQSMTYSMLAILNDKLGNQNLWKLYLNESMEIAEELGHPILYSLAHYQLLVNHIKFKKYKKAIREGKKALDYLKSNDIQLYSADIDSLLHEVYLMTNQPDSAIHYLKSYYSKKNNVLTENNRLNAQELNFQHKLEKKEIEVKNRDVQLSLQKRITQLFILFSILLSLTIIGYLVFRNKIAHFQSSIYKKDKQVDDLINLVHELIVNEFEDNDPLFTDENRKLIFNQFMAALEEEKVFLDQELNQKKFATILKTNKRYLYEAISFNTKDNFKDIINSFRVQEAKKLIKQLINSNSYINNNEISEKSGFNSITTFYRGFKKHTGLTPKEYIEEYKAELIRNKTRPSANTNSQSEDNQNKTFRNQNSTL